MNCGDVKDRTVDFLYEELPEAERQAFDAHLRGCAGCRAEVDAMARTLRVSRNALQALAEAPPSRVRAAVLAASAEARAEGARAGGARRFWDWLRRPWALPAFAAAAALLVFALGRKVIVRTPEETFRMSEPSPAQEVQAEPERAQAAAPKSEPAAAPRPESAAALDREQSKRTTGPRRDVQVDRSRLRVEAKPQSSSRSTRRSREVSARPSEIVPAAPPAPHPEARAKRAADAPFEGGPALAAPPAAPAAERAPPAASAPAADRAAPAAIEPSRPSAARVAGSAAPAPAKSEAEDGLDVGVAGGRAPTAGAAAGAVPLAELAVRADRAYEERRFAEAARAYRELLRRAPRDERVATWRQRLAASERALTPPE